MNRHSLIHSLMFGICIGAAAITARPVAAVQTPPAAPRSTLIAAADLVAMAESHPLPEMPAIAGAAGVRAPVIVLVEVSPQGVLSQMQVLRSHPMLEGAALDALARWTFRPRAIDQPTVGSIVTFTFDPRGVTIAEDPKVIPAAIEATRSCEEVSRLDDTERTVTLCSAADEAVRRIPSDYRPIFLQRVEPTLAASLVRTGRYREAEPLLARLAAESAPTSPSRFRLALLRVLTDVRTRLGKHTTASTACREAETEAERERNRYQAGSEARASATTILSAISAQCANILDLAGKPEEASAARKRASSW